MKKLLIALTVASMMGSAMAGQYTRPCDQWTVGITGIWLKPSLANSDNAYDVITNVSGSTSTIANQSSVDQIINHQYDPGFIVSLGYRPCPCNDFTLSYLRLHTSDTDSYGPVQRQSNFSASPSPSSFRIRSGSGQDTFNLDQVDLTAGHTINLANCIDTHFFAGLRYAKIDRTLSASISERGLPGVSITPANVFLSLNNQFWGIGPLGGIDGTWWIMNCFGLVGSFDTALLVGDPDSTENVTINTLSSPPSQNNVNFDFNNNNHQVIPMLDAKLGAVYKTQFMSSFCLKLEAGYQVLHYFNVLKTVDVVTALNSATNASIGTADTIKHPSDLSLDGPYFGATISFA